LKMNKTPCQAFKTCVFEKKKIATYMDLWKYGPILGIQKPITT
jgi:hypothetical protein